MPPDHNMIDPTNAENPAEIMSAKGKCRLTRLLSSQSNKMCSNARHNDISMVDDFK